MNPEPLIRISRRHLLLSASSALVAARQLPAWGAETAPDLSGEVGITTGSFMRHLATERTPGKLRLLDLPRIMRDELDMRVIDLMTRTLASMEPRYLDEFRQRADDAGCILTNLKMNQPHLEMASPDKSRRDAALAEYKRTIDAAQRLGCRWVRPLPGPQRPELQILAASYRELIDYAGPKGISLLIENYGWLANDPTAIPTLVAAVGPGLAVSPDTGNWSDAVRREGLAKAFPHAVTCDFKAFTLEADGGHPQYDLRRCFQIGWEAGFRGPWCLEHFHDNLAGLMAGFAQLRDRLRAWMREPKTFGKD